MAEAGPRKWARGLAALAAAVALAGLPAWRALPWLLPGLLLAQPLFALGVAWLRGTRLGPDRAERGLRDAVAMLLLWAAAAGLMAALAAWPLQALRATGSLASALGLSFCLGLWLVMAWRGWPAFGLAARQGGGLAALAAVPGAHAATARGLALALLLALPVGLGLAAAWPGLVDADAQRVLLLAHLALAPLVHLALNRHGEPPPPPALLPVLAPEPEAERPPSGAPEGLADPDERLYAAARSGRVDAALSALEDGADPHALPIAGDRDQRTLAMLAAVLVDLRLLRELIRLGVDLNLRHGGLTPLLAATRDSWHGRTEAVMTLLANGADPRLTDTDGQTPLHHAARSTDPGVAALLLDAGAQLEALDAEGWSPLGIACLAGNWRLAKFLIERGARPEPANGQPALLAAASGEDDPAGVQLLLRHKAKVDARGAGGRSALLVAAAAGNAEVLGALLHAHADVGGRDHDGMVALLEVARAGHEACLVRLAAAQPDPAAADARGANALLHAVVNPAVEPGYIRRLLELGVDPRQPDAEGRTAVDAAVALGRWRLVVALDPAHPLPSSVSEDLAAGPRERTPRELLRDALAERRFDAAADLLALDAGAGLDAPAASTLLLEFAAEGDADAWDWLLDRGVRADVPLREGDTVVFHLLDRGGVGAPALWRLCERGVAPSGRGGLARYLAACLAGEHTSRGHEQLALALLERGADAFAAAGEGEGPLALAVRLGWMRLAGQLLAMGVDPNRRDARGMGPLHLACQLGREAAVRLLVRHGASPELASADGQTPLGIALSAGRRDLSTWLEWRGWKLPARALRPADLPAAAIAGDADAVRRLVELGLPVDAVDSQGCSALLRASGGGHEAVVERLLAAGADTALAARTGATPLSAAVSMRHAGIVDRLLAAGAAVDLALPGGVTPLMLAAALGLPELVGRLLAHGADVHARDAQGLGPLHCAALYAFQARDRQRVLALFDTLLLAGAEPDQPSGAGQSPLLLLLGARAEAGTACEEEVLLAALERLLQEGVALDAAEQRGFTPLHLAALHGLLRVVQRLLREGADRGRRDTLNRTPHEIAVLRGFVDVAAEFEPGRGAGPGGPSFARFLRERE